MDIRVEVVDSYRNISDEYWERLGRFYSENVWKMTDDAAERVRTCFTAFEYEYAVKWFEISAFYHDEIVGFMRMLRNPDDDSEWYICDVHAANKYRHRGIASAMYKEAFQLVKSYESVEYIMASVSASNTKSIGLHQKFGFVDTGKYPHFCNFSFDDDETMLKCRILTEYPAFNGDVHRRILYRLMRQYFAKEGLTTERPADRVKKMFKKMENHPDCKFGIIWCGNNPVGFRFTDRDEKLEFINE